MRPFCCLNEFVRHLFEFAFVYFNIVEADGETYRAVELHYALNLAVVLLELEQAEHAERNDFAMQVVMSVLGYSRAVVAAKGYNLFATGGTHRFLTENNIPSTLVYWPSEEGEPQALSMLHQKQIDLVVNIPRDLSAGELDNGYKIRRAAIDLNIPLITNARLASAFITAFCNLSIDDIRIKSWQEYK